MPFAMPTVASRTLLLTKLIVLKQVLRTLSGLTMKGSCYLMLLITIKSKKLLKMWTVSQLRLNIDAHEKRVATTDEAQELMKDYSGTPLFRPPLGQKLYTLQPIKALHIF